LNSLRNNACATALRNVQGKFSALLKMLRAGLT
jgi:hypothetical protein